MRLFIATPVTIPIYSVIKTKLSPYIKGNWTIAPNLHLTHLFIGEDEPSRYKIELEVPNEKITIKSFGMFGDKILYLKATSPNIDSIYKQLQKRFNIKNKAFTPHITLCRVKSIEDKDALLNAIKSFENIEFQNDFSVYLYESILTKSGPIYKKIYKY